MDESSTPVAPASRRLRGGRVSTPGQVYLVTACVHERRAIFARWEAASEAARVTKSTDVFGDGRLLAWVLMPDHFHGLLLLGEAFGLSETMRRFKGNVAVRVNRLLKTAGALWQPGFHDHAMRHEEDLETIARYIVANPVRAGLVDKAGDYPFWNAEWL